MRSSKTLAKVRSSQPARICSLGHYVPAYVRHAAHFGYDCLWLDLEHRLIDERSVQALLAYCHLADIDCMVRPSTTDRAKLYRYLEDGATGFMIPHVSTAVQAKYLADAVKFPPIGNRGLDGAGLDGDFLLSGREKFSEQANRETFLVVQIESLEAVDNVDAIASVEGVDGLFLGPADLTLRLQHSERDLDLAKCEELVSQACQKHGKFWGMPVGTTDEVKRLHQQGAQLLAHGNDFLGMMQMLERSAKHIDQATSTKA